MIDPEQFESDQEFEQKVRSTFQMQDPDQLFIDRLEKELADRFKDIGRSKESRNKLPGRSQWLDKGKLLFSPLGWGAIAIIFILFLIWGIKTLIPKVEPSIQSTLSPLVSPSAPAEPTQAKGVEGVINLPVSAGMPVPWPEEIITSENVDRISLLARWGKGMISEIAWSPDGKSFAVFSSTGIYFYDAVTFEETKIIDKNLVYGNIAFSPDGTMLAVSGSADNSIALLDAASGNQLRILPGSANFISHLGFSPDGEILATVIYGEPLKLWDVSSGQELGTLSGISADNFAFSPDGSVLATTSGHDRLVRLWDVNSGQELRQFSGHTDYVYGLAFSPDGTMLASTSNDMTIRLWEVATGNVLQTISQQSGDVAFLPDGKTLAASFYDRPIMLWDIATGKLVNTFGEETKGGSMKFSPDGKAILTYIYSSNVIRLLDSSSGQELNQLGWNTYDVSGIAISPDSKTLAAGTPSGSIVFFDITTGQQLRTLTGHSGGVESLAFSPDGTRLASGSGSSAKLWDVASGTELSSMVGQSCSWGCTHPCVAFSPDGKILAFGAEGTGVILWDVTNNVQLSALNAATGTLHGFGGVSNVAFSPDGTLLASGNESGAVVVWDVASGEKLQYLMGQTDIISGLVFSPDGKNLISAAQNKHIMFWDTTTWSEIRTVSWIGEVDELNLVLSPDGSIMASGGGSTPAVLWNSATGEAISTLTSSARELAFSPDGKVLITFPGESTIRLLGIAPENAASSEAAEAPAGVGVVSVSTPVPQVTPVELGIEKIPLPLLLTGENIQPISFSPDESYLLFNQQGPMGEPGENQANNTLSFLDSRTGETCQGIQETVAFTQTEWGASPIGVDLYERTAWMDDQRLLYISPSGQLGAISRCDNAVENLGDGISDRLLSFLGSSNIGEWQIVIRGEQAFWLFTPSIDQAVKLDVPVPPEEQYTPIRWSPWDAQLITSWVDRRPDGLWIILERIDMVTGSTSPLYEVEAPEQLYNIQPVSIGFSWVRQDLILLEGFGWMGLVDLSSQPPRFTDLLSDVFGIDEQTAYDLSAWGTMPHTDVQEYIHVMAATGMTSDGQFYLYHLESGLVDRYPLNPPLLIVYPGGDGGIAEPYGESVPANDIYRVVFVDRDTEPYDLQVKGHLPRSGLFSLTANVLPGAEQVLFSSSNGISLVDLTTGETTKFWSYENQDQFIISYTWASRDGKTMLAFAGPQEMGAAADMTAMYWLRLEP